MALVGTNAPQMLALRRSVSAKHQGRSGSVRIVTRCNKEHVHARQGKRALALLSSLLAAPAAFADELELVQPLKASSVPQWSSVPIPSFEGVPDDFVSFLSTNPLLLVGGVAAIGIPALLAQGLLGGAGGAKGTSPANALEALSEDKSVLLVDIRSSASAKEQGSPAPGRTAGKSISLPYTKVSRAGEVEPVEGWAQRLTKALKEDSVIILLDADGKEASKAAAALAEAAEVGTLYYVQGGAAAWKAAELPWKEKGFGFALPSLKLPDFAGGFDSLAEDFKAAPTGGKAALAVGAIGAAAFLLANELGNILEIVGVVGAVNLVGRNLLFSKDRSSTAKKLKSLVDDKIAVGEAGEDFKKLARTVLDTPKPAASKAAAKVKETVSKITDKAEDVASKVEAKADETAKNLSSSASKVEAKADETAKKVDNTAKDTAKSTENGSEAAKSEAKEWIDNWKTKTNT